MIALVSLMFLATFGRVMNGGACTTKDVNQMTAAGGGHSKNSFPEMTATCATSSFNIFSGFQKQKFMNCLTAKVSLTHGFAMCFADYGDFGYKNCYFPCIAKWCSNACLTCTKTRTFSNVQDLMTKLSHSQPNVSNW